MDAITDLLPPNKQAALKRSNELNSPHTTLERKTEMMTEEAKVFSDTGQIREQQIIQSMQGVSVANNSLDLMRYVTAKGFNLRSRRTVRS